MYDRRVHTNCKSGVDTYLFEKLWYTIFAVKTTRYFREQVMRKRPYIKNPWITKALKNPIKRETQSDGRVRSWIYIKELEGYLRAITLEDRKTVHNAFPDRNFKK